MLANRVVRDPVEVDVFAQAGTGGHVDHAVVAHGVNDRVQVFWRCVVVDERVQEAAFVPASVEEAAEDGEIGWAI